jgi:hypothetical protein
MQRLLHRKSPCELYPSFLPHTPNGPSLRIQASCREESPCSSVRAIPSPPSPVPSARAGTPSIPGTRSCAISRSLRAAIRASPPPCGEWDNLHTCEGSSCRVPPMVLSRSDFRIKRAHWSSDIGVSVTVVSFICPAGTGADQDTAGCLSTGLIAIEDAEPRQREALCSRMVV